MNAAMHATVIASPACQRSMMNEASMRSPVPLRSTPLMSVVAGSITGASTEGAAALASVVGKLSIVSMSSGDTVASADGAAMVEASPEGVSALPSTNTSSSTGAYPPSG